MRYILSYIILLLTISISIYSLANFSHYLTISCVDIVDFSDLTYSNKGVTCTGLSYDKKRDVWYIADIGKNIQDSYGTKLYRKLLKKGEKYNSRIVVVSKDFHKIINTIPCSEIFPNCKDVQGVAYDKFNDSLWYVSPGENLIRNIDMEGRCIREITVENPSGIACNTKDDTVWVLTSSTLYNLRKDGEILNLYSLNIKGLDQIFIDEDMDILLITVGDNYYVNNYLYTFSLSERKIVSKIALENSYAIEGVAILDDILFIINDGYYHKAKIPKNIVALYKYNDIKNIISKDRGNGI